MNRDYDIGKSASEGDVDIVDHIMDNGERCIIRYRRGRDEERLCEVLEDIHRRFGEKKEPVSLLGRLTDVYVWLFNLDK